MVTLSPTTSEAGVRFPAWPHVGKLVVACRWSAVYSTEPYTENRGRINIELSPINVCHYFVFSITHVAWLKKFTEGSL